MTIQRQYSLPNCTLFLEGLSDATTGSGQLEARPVMSILVNAECHLAGGKPTITGGRDFFESLVKAVSRYAQELLSGVPHPAQDDRPIPLVQLRNLDRNLHRLIVYNQGDVAVVSHSGTANSKPATPIEIDLTTVQMFDLVEAVDQFFADSQTLPDLSLQLIPLQRRYAKSDEPVAKRVAPAVLGVSSLAVAAIAFFFVPIPEVQKPKDPLLQPNSGSISPSPTAAGSDQTTTAEPTLSPLPLISPTTADPTSPLPTVSPTAEGLTSTPTPSPTDTPTTDALTSPTPSLTNTPTTDPFPTPSPSPTDTPTTDPLTTPSPSATDTPTPGALISPSASPLSASPLSSPAALIPAPEITDPAVIDSLNRKLYEQVDGAWRNRSGVDRELIYRVSVDENGTVVGYKPVNSAAGDAVQQTPLPSLLQPPTASSDTIQQKPIAEFKVVFSSRGVPQVSPWKGLTETAQSRPEILDTSQLRQLNRQLYNQIQQNRQGELQFPEKLEYRVAVRPDGTVVDYEARNQPAFNYANQTPLPTLKASASSIAPATGSQESLAYFKVVFTRKGILQVSPWYGYR